jgi:hypothetical protein
MGEHRYSGSKLVAQAQLERVDSHLSGSGYAKPFHQGDHRPDDAGKYRGAIRVLRSKVGLYSDHALGLQPRLLQDRPQPRAKRRVKLLLA